MNTASSAELVGIPGAVAYVASKHAVVGMTRAAALQYAERGIRINAVCPGTTNTTMTALARERRGGDGKVMAGVPMGRRAAPEEIAEAVVWLCSQSADFELQPDTPKGECGLLRIDHVAQSMRVEEFLSWILFYLTLFETEMTAPVHIAERVGLVQSQAIQTPDGRLRITLNGAAGLTPASRFVDNYLGAGVRHIALETDAIFATADALAKNAPARLAAQARLNTESQL